MRLDEFQLPANTETEEVSVEDQQKILSVVAAGDAAWTKPLELDEAIALARKFAGASDVR